MVSVPVENIEFEVLIKEKELETITITERGSEIDSRNKNILHNVL